METYEAVRTVLAVRSYAEKSVPADVATKIIEAGRLTASSMNRQPWHFIVVEDRALLDKLGAAAKTGPYIAKAPLAVVVAVDSVPFVEATFLLPNNGVAKEVTQKFDVVPLGKNTE